ncbi:MAG: post-COAP-1 domain-containing protein [Actinomycetota bacterium]
MHKRILVMLAVLAMAFAVVPAASADGTHPGLTPDSVDEVVFPGQYVEIEKTVHTPDLPPALDVCLIVDLSGSYGNDLASIKALAPGIWDDIVAGGVADLQMGLATFVDFPFSPWGGSSDYAYRLDQQLTPTKTTWVTAVNAMTIFWGNDGPESQYEAFYQVATGAGNDVLPVGESRGDIPADQGCNFRDDATKVAILTTDAPFHNAGDSGPFPYPGHSAADTEAALVAGDIVVIGLKAPGAGGELDALAAATGGTTVATTSTSSDIASAILTGLGAIEVDVSMTSDCEAPITTTFDPPVVTVTGGEHAVFTETISVAAGAPGGTYECKDWALIDGEPMVDEAGAIIYETKTIRVSTHFLTGGGQIDKANKAKTFGGNIGYLEDGTLVGQWQFRDGAEKINMHSLSIDTLVFSNDGGEPADPPAADMNVAEFSGTARVKFGNAKWIDSCTFSAQAEDHGEPGVDDVFGISINCGDGIMDYVPVLLDAGNLQIHKGFKG